MKTFKVKRPWGTFTQFTHNEKSTVKILEIKPKEMAVECFVDDTEDKTDDSIIAPTTKDTTIATIGDMIRQIRLSRCHHPRATLL